MPVFFQHRFSETQILIWKAEETESFFGERLPHFDPNRLPKHPAKRIQFLAGRYLLKSLHPEFDFSRVVVSDFGRPYLSDSSMQFSISHSGDYIAVITDPTRAVGIDVECINDRAARVHHKFLIAAEQELLRSKVGALANDSSDLVHTMAWAIKEAAFKALHQSGVDFMRDLPIELVDQEGNEYSVQLGGRGGELEIRAMILGPICLAWAGRELRDES